MVWLRAVCSDGKVDVRCPQVKGVRLSKFTLLTPVTKIDSLTCHIVTHGVNTTLAATRVIDTGKLCCHGRGAGSVLGVTRRRRPMSLRLFNDSPTVVTLKTGIVRGTNTSVMSVGVKYPVRGIMGGDSNSTLVGGIPLTRRVVSTMTTTIGVPIAMGVHLN